MHGHDFMFGREAPAACALALNWGHGQAGPGWQLHAQLTVAALAGKHDATTAPLWREPDLRARAPPTISADARGRSAH